MARLTSAGAWRGREQGLEPSVSLPNEKEAWDPK
ncbi:hypothetical protein RR48_08853 [Papilio machaon]|uniref:Uncharacterized protein n=1 Tax=Papilio machaon TaxID=76193 RepID=A0A194QVA5_PAPMA|nr:hypothetical protein RR48_08853 [Papilio machaon]